MRVATIINGVVDNIVIRPQGYALAAGEVDVTEVSPAPGKGWSYDGEAFASNVPDPDAVTLARETILEAALGAGVSPSIPPDNDDVSGWQALACSIVDAKASASREAIGTPGYAQVEEYTRTEADARAFQTAYDADPATDPEDYPFLAAEIAAQATATGTTPPASAVATEILAEATVWNSQLAAIKQPRRASKLQIAAAQDLEAIAAILAAVTWPEVG